MSVAQKQLGQSKAELARRLEFCAPAQLYGAIDLELSIDSWQSLMQLSYVNLML